MRCNISAAWHQPVHTTLCRETNRQIAELEKAGWYQEKYDIQRIAYTDWNEGVLNHGWTFERGPCTQCHLVGLCVAVGRFQICKTCLTEFQNVSWHPTGEIHPKWMAFVTHSINCSVHEPSTSSEPSSKDPEQPINSPSASD